jgi:hypothetical protein
MIYQIWMMMMVTATVITTFEILPGKRPSNVTPQPQGENPDAGGK